MEYSDINININHELNVSFLVTVFYSFLRTVATLI